MTHDTASVRCECGYECQGGALDERVADGQRHARDTHGIDVSPEQVIKQGGAAW